jgi:zinc transport system substrate-binding protein
MTISAKWIMRAIVPVFLLLVMTTATADSATAANVTHQPKIKVLSTFKPVSALVAAIAGNQVDISQLIPDNASPHFYTLKPSSIRKIKQADLIFRIGKNMEMMLGPVFEKLSDKAKLITLSEQAKLHFLPITSGHSHSHHDEDHDGENTHQRYDPHIWTSPKNALAMAKVITQSLTKADTKNKSYYQQNLKQFTSRINSISKKITLQLKPVAHKPYVVFHNSWQYFIHYFNLHEPTVISLQESITPGIKTLLKARKEIASKEIGCIFSSPEISPQRVKVINENMHMKIVSIDVLGRKLALNQTTYINWLDNMGEQVLRCLQ